MMALGKAIVAFLPAEQQWKAVKRAKDANPALSEQKLLNELVAARENGYATNQPRSGVPAMAAPIFDGHKSVCAGLTVTGTPAAWKRAGNVLKHLKDTAKEISINSRSIQWEQLT
jgi:DNA-binding IclR family transcriptional regulator